MFVPIVIVILHSDVYLRSSTPSHKMGVAKMCWFSTFWRKMCWFGFFSPQCIGPNFLSYVRTALGFRYVMNPERYFHCWTSSQRTVDKTQHRGESCALTRTNRECNAEEARVNELSSLVPSRTRSISSQCDLFGVLFVGETRLKSGWTRIKERDRLSYLFKRVEFFPTCVTGGSRPREKKSQNHTVDEHIGRKEKKNNFFF